MKFFLKRSILVFVSNLFFSITFASPLPEIENYSNRVQEQIINMQPDFANNVDAAVSTKNYVYLFKGEEYIRINMNNRKVDDGYPKNIRAEWKLPVVPYDFNKDIDAAVRKGKYVYFFKGNQYVRHDIETHKTSTGYPKSINVWRLPAEFQSDLDAAIYRTKSNGVSADKIYFFKGNKYVRFDVAADQVDKNPTSMSVWNISSGYGNSPDAAVNFGENAYFFKNNSYAVFNLKTNTASTVAPKKTQAHFYVYSNYLKSFRFRSLPFGDSLQRTSDGSLHCVIYDCINAIDTQTQDVRIAFYMWNKGDISNKGDMKSPRDIHNKLIARADENQENVDVKFMMDLDYFSSQSDIDGIKNSLEEAGVEVTINSDKYNEIGNLTGNTTLGQSGTPKMHNKTMLFRRLHFDSTKLTAGSELYFLGDQTLEWVVLETSANVWPSQYKQANDLILYHGNEAFYEYKMAEWERIQAKQAGKIAFSKTKVDQTVENVRCYSFPRPSDPFNTFLESMESPDTIRIAMAFWSRNNIATKLKQLKNNHNTHIEVVLRDWNSPAQATVISNLKSAGIKVYKLKTSANRKLHTKFMAYYGKYKGGGLLGGKMTQGIVWTGSHNYTNPALNENSETLTRIDDNKVYREYSDYWEDLKYNSTQL